MLSDSVLIIFISMFTALLSEGLSWLLIYRTEKFKRLQSEVERQSKKRKSDFCVFVYVDEKENLNFIYSSRKAKGNGR
jgi:hypothetical protein